MKTPRDETMALVAAVAARHGVTLGDLLSPRRGHRLAPARHDAMRTVARQRPHLSIAEIARLFRRHHTTVLYALGRRPGQCPLLDRDGLAVAPDPMEEPRQCI